MFANARAIARLAALTGDEGAAADFNERAAAIKARVQADLWSPTLGHFVDRYKVDNAVVKYWQPIRGRELVGYLPWTFDLVDDEARYAAAWRHAFDGQELVGRRGCVPSSRATSITFASIVTKAPRPSASGTARSGLSRRRRC